MCVGLFIALLDIQIVSASLADIGGGLSASRDEVAWVQTSYLIAEIIVIPLSGWLSRVMSTRWLFCVSAAGFTAASLLCGWAWDIRSMIVFRALQGFLGGSMIPTVFTTAFVYFAGPRRVMAAAVVGALASLAPTLGPTVGGWITDHYSWRWLFFVNLVLGAFVAVVVLPSSCGSTGPNLSLLRGADYAGDDPDGGLPPRLPRIRFGGRPPLELVRGPRDPRQRLDRRAGGKPWPSSGAQPALTRIRSSICARSRAATSPSAAFSPLSRGWGYLRPFI